MAAKLGVGPQSNQGLVVRGNLGLMPLQMNQSEINAQSVRLLLSLQASTHTSQR